MPVKHVLIFTCLHNFAHLSTANSIYVVLNGVYIYPDNMCRFLGLCLIICRTVCLVKCHNQSVSFAPAYSSCITPDNRAPEQIFSIDVYSNMRGPVVPLLRKKMCISSAPYIDIRIGQHHFNLLNATISAAACRTMYQQLVCRNVAEIRDDDCMYANQIMFAAAQKIIECDSDTDCLGIRQTYDMPLLWCEWSQQISQHVCRRENGAMPMLQQCEPSAATALRIRNACIFTNPVCSFVVDNISIMAPLLGIGLFCISFSVIYFLH